MFIYRRLRRFRCPTNRVQLSPPMPPRPPRLTCLEEQLEKEYLVMKIVGAQSPTFASCFYPKGIYKIYSMMFTLLMFYTSLEMPSLYPDPKLTLFSNRIAFFILMLTFLANTTNLYYKINRMTYHSFEVVFSGVMIIRHTVFIVTFAIFDRGAWILPLTLASCNVFMFTVNLFEHIRLQKTCIYPRSSKLVICDFGLDELNFLRSFEHWKLRR